MTLHAMDEVIDRSGELRRRRVRVVVAGLVTVGLLAFGYGRVRPRTHYVPLEGVHFGSVEEGSFREAVAVQGTVEPLQLVYLDTADGGRVEEVLLREGARVAQGDLIVRLVNADLELEVIRQDDLLQGALQSFRETELRVDQNRRSAERERLEIEHDLLVRKKDLEVQENLREQSLTPEVDYLRAVAETEFWERRLELFLEGEARDATFRAGQLRQAREAVTRRRDSLATARSKADRLEIRAPLDGVLTSLEAEVGATKASGERLGQVDATGFEIRAQVDQVHASRVAVGLQASLTALGGASSEEASLVVSQVFDQVVDGRFRVDLAFEDGDPAGLKRGQRVNVRLFVGDGESAILLPKGAFHQRTGGRWVFVVEEGGGEARRRDIRLGRQNPDYYEVLQGLSVGDRVVLSRYDAYGDNERLVFKN